MKNWIAFALMFVSSLAFGQFVTITGTVQSPTGVPYSSGTGVATLEPANVQWLVNGTNPVPTPITIATLNSAGQFSVSLTNTSLIQPSTLNPAWQFSFCSQSISGQAPICFTMTPMVLTSSQDISVQIKAQSLPLPSTGGSTIALQTNGIPNSTQTLLNLIAGSGISVTNNIGGTTFSTSAPQIVGLWTSCTSGFLAYNGTCSTPGGSGGTPGGTIYNVQANSGVGTFIGVTAATNPGFIVTNGPSSPPISQQKASYDVRDWGLACNGSTADTVALQSLLTAIGSTQATIAVPVDSTHPGPCRVSSINLPANITLDVSGGGSFSLIANATTPGLAAFVQGAGTSNSSPSASCSVTLSGTTAGNSIVFLMEQEYDGGNTPNAPTDGKNTYSPAFSSSPFYAQVDLAWTTANIVGGNITITANLNGGSVVNACQAHEYSGLGPAVGVDGSSWSAATSSTLLMSSSPVSSGPPTLHANDLVIGFGGQLTASTNATCTAGSGYTQPSSTAGTVDTNQVMCSEYILNGAGGLTTATQLLSAGQYIPPPVNNIYWNYAMIALRPTVSTMAVLGGIVDPDLHQIFYDATGTNGSVDFTGNLTISRVYPEWWGASPNASAATNAPALQASVNGAFGCGYTPCRTNNSGLNVYNKTLDLSRGHYQINAELQFYHVIGSAGSRFQVDCGTSGGVIQTTPGLRIIDGQSVAYGVFNHCYWGNAATNPFQVKGSVTGGTFSSGEVVLQTGTSSKASLVGTVTGSGPMQMGAWQASYGQSWVNATSTWVGQTSGAIFTPTSAPYQSNALIDMDYNALQGIDLAPQFLDFEENTFVGGGNADVGLLIAKTGGTAQGSNIYCHDCEGNGFSGAVWQAGGNNTDRNVGRFYAYNALDLGWYGGDMEANPRYGLATYGAGFAFTRDVTFENSFLGQTGFDQYCESPQGTCLADNDRSESRRPIAGGTLRYTNSQVQNQALSATPGITWPVGYLIMGSNLGDGKYYLVTASSSGFGGIGTQQYPLLATGGSANTIVDTNSQISGSLTSGTFTTGETVTQTTSGAHGIMVSEDVQNGLFLSAITGSPGTCPTNCYTWVGGTSGAVFTPTATPAAVFTASAYVGYQVSIFTGAGAGETCVVASNTTTTITCVNPWAQITSYYAYLGVANPASGSQFIVEPNWGAQTTSGGMTWTAWTENAIQGLNNENGTAGNGPTVSPYMENDYVPGDTIWTTGGTIKNLVTTRGDWLYTNGSPVSQLDNYSGQIGQIDFDNVLNQNGQPWQFPRYNPSSATIFKGFSQKNMGTMPIVWSSGNGSAAEADVEIGGRNDGGSGGTGTDPSRIIMQIGGLLGPPTPIGTNQNAGSVSGWSPFGFNCGLSTGSGTAGICNFYTGTVGSSGTQINPGTIAMTLGPLGLTENTSVKSPQFCIGASCITSWPAGSLSGMTAGQIPVAATASTVTSSKALQGTDVSILTAGTVSGTTAALCTDSNGGATTVGCLNAGLSGMTAGQVPIAATSTSVTSSEPLNGAGAGIVTGPSSATAGHAAVFTGSAGQIQDGGAAPLTSSGVSGMTAGQIPVAATATTITSSEPLAGSGAGIVTGPVSGTVAGHVVIETGANGQVQDSGTAISSLISSTGTQYALTDWTTTGTLGSIVGSVSGQVPVAVNGAPPVFASGGVPIRAVTTGSTDAILCDSSTTTQDRTKTVIYATGSTVTVTVPDVATSGCGSNMAFSIVVGNWESNSSSTVVTINNTSASVFFVQDGTNSSSTSGVTTFKVTSGQFLTFRSDTSNWLVTKTSVGIQTGTPTYTPGTNVTSVACASGYTCTNQRGELTIVGGTATTGTIATVNFSTTLGTAPGLCMVTQEGGATLFGIGHGTPSSSSFTITAGVSVATSTLAVDYSCVP